VQTSLFQTRRQKAQRALSPIDHQGQKVIRKWLLLVSPILSRTVLEPYSPKVAFRCMAENLLSAEVETRSHPHHWRCKQAIGSIEAETHSQPAARISSRNPGSNTRGKTGTKASMRTRSSSCGWAPSGRVFLTPSQQRNSENPLQPWPNRQRAIGIICATTCLRVCEVLGLKWQDIDVAHQLMNLQRSFVGGAIGPRKTEISRQPVPVDGIAVEGLLAWREFCSCGSDEDWVFGSER
jgi:hypothetical protein